MEVLQHDRDVVACAFRPDGRQLAASTLDGNIHLWDPLEGDLQVRPLSQSPFPTTNSKVPGVSLYALPSLAPPPQQTAS